MHFEVPAGDPETLTQYYHDLFGWKVQHEAEMDYWMIETVPSDAQGAPRSRG